MTLSFNSAMSELLKHLVYYYEPKLAFFIEQNGVSFNSFAPIWVNYNNYINQYIIIIIIIKLYVIII